MQNNIIILYDFIFNGVNLTNSCEGKMFGVISDNELKFEQHIRIGKADIVFLRLWKEKSQYLMKSQFLTLATVY